MKSEVYRITITITETLDLEVTFAGGLLLVVSQRSVTLLPALGGASGGSSLILTEAGAKWTPTRTRSATGAARAALDARHRSSSPLSDGRGTKSSSALA